MSSGVGGQGIAKRLWAAALAVSVLGFALAPSAGAKEAIAYFGTETGAGSLGGQFSGPGDVEVNSSGAGPADAGDVYVVDAGNHRLQRFAQDDNGTPGDPFDDSFTFVSAWGAGVDDASPGDGYEICTVAADCKAAAASGANGAFGNLGESTGVAVDQDTGDVYVSDSGNNRINVYAGEGTFLRSFGFDVVASGPGEAGAGYEVCVAANGDICKAGVGGGGVGQIASAHGIAVSPADGAAATGTVFLADGGNLRIDTFGLDGSSPASFGSAAVFTGQPVRIAVDARGIVYVSYFNGTGQVVARYDSEDANGGGVGFLAPITVPPLAVSVNTPNRQIRGLEVDPDSDGGGPDTDVLYVLRNLGPEPETVVQQFGPVNAPGLAAAPPSEDAHHGAVAGFNFVSGLGLDALSGRLFVSTDENIGGPASLPDDNHGVYVLDAAGTLPEATLDSLSEETASSVTLNGTIDPNGPPTVSYRTEYSLDGTDWIRGGAEIPLGTQEDPQEVSVTIEPPQGFTPGAFYHVRLVASKRFAIPVPSNELTFIADPSPPLVETVGAPVRSATTATLNGRVNPRLAPTQFHFEYVTAAQFAASGFAGAQSTPARIVGIDEVQQITVIGTSGQFRLSFEGEGTTDLPFDAPASVVQSALQALPAIGAGNIRVRGGGAGSGGKRTYTVLFSGDLAATDVGEITGADGTTPLDDDAGGTVATLTQGGGGKNEVQELTIKAVFGQYRLSFGSQTTLPLEPSPAGAAAEVQSRLGALSSIGPANIAVSGGPGNATGSTPYRIEFKGALANKDVGQLSLSELSSEPLEIAKGVEHKTTIEGGSEDLSRLVSARVSGLDPATAYRYRVVAGNGNPGSPVAGEAMVLATRASDAPLDHGDFPGPIGSDRAYEQINLPDTGGNPVSGTGPFASNGNRALYTITGGTPVSETAAGDNRHFAERTPGGWQTRKIFPPRSLLLGSGLQVIGTNADFSTVYAMNTSLTAELDPAGEVGLWRLGPGGAPTKIWELGPGQERSIGSSGVALPPRVASGNELIAAMLRGANLDPDFPSAEGAVDNIYEVGLGASPRLLSPMPGGEPADCGVIAEGFELSADGSRLFFASSGDECGARPDLYLREINAGQTRLLSGPVISGAACGGSMIRSNDEAAFFFSQSRLVADDTPAAPGCPAGSDGDVYRYALASGALRCVTCVAVDAAVDADVHVPFGFGVPSPRSSIAVAPDGTRVYFQSPHPLLPGTPATDGGGSLYVTEPGSGALRWVAPVGFSQSSNTDAITADGAAIQFRSNEPALNPVGGTENGGTAQVYRYDDRDRSLICVSCPIDGSEPAGMVSNLDVAALSDSGEHLAFATPTPLVGGDQNTSSAGADPATGMDVYEWRDGRLFMVTDGLTKWPREFESPAAAGMSPSGQDLYFLAAAQLTPDALDGYRRLYTARIGGGIVFPPPEIPCALEVCQGTPRGAPEEAPPGTSSVRGAGNPPNAKTRPCPQGKRKVKRKGRVRCVKRGRAKHRRSAKRAAR